MSHFIGKDLPSCISPSTSISLLQVLLFLFNLIQFTSWPSSLETTHSPQKETLKTCPVLADRERPSGSVLTLWIFLNVFFHSVLSHLKSKSSNLYIASCLALSFKVMNCTLFQSHECNVLGVSEVSTCLAYKMGLTWQQNPQTSWNAWCALRSSQENSKGGSGEYNDVFPNWNWQPAFSGGNQKTDLRAGSLILITTDGLVFTEWWGRSWVNE